MVDSTKHKTTLRAQLRRAMAGLDAAKLAKASSAACELLASTPEFARAQSVMLFLPLAHEVDTRTLALRAWQQQKLVAIPLVSYEQKHMLPVELRSLEEPLERDRYGVASPKGAPQPIDTIDLVVVPGLGFDHRGHRIGRGLGFYDRFLASPSFRGISCGLCLHQQVVDAVPVQPHDVPLRMLVTDRQILRFVV